MYVYRNLWWDIAKEGVCDKGGRDFIVESFMFFDAMLKILFEFD
jgi:hypothetical protein